MSPTCDSRPASTLRWMPSQSIGARPAVSPVASPPFGVPDAFSAARPRRPRLPDGDSA